MKHTKPSWGCLPSLQTPGEPASTDSFLGFAMPGREEKLFSGSCLTIPSKGKRVGFSVLSWSLWKSCSSEPPLSGNRTHWNAGRPELTGVLTDFFEPGEEADREMQLIAECFDDLVKTGAVSLFDEKVPLQVVRSYLERTPRPKPVSD